RKVTAWSVKRGTPGPAVRCPGRGPGRGRTRNPRRRRGSRTPPRGRAVTKCLICPKGGYCSGTSQGGFDILRARGQRAVVRPAATLRTTGAHVRSAANTKHLFVTGGVASSLGKGLTASSLGRLLKLRGL